MKALRFVLPVAAIILFCTALKAEDKPDTPTPFSKPGDAPKTENGELPKAPEGKPGIEATHQNESLIGELVKGGAPDKAALKNMTKAEKKAAKGGLPDPNALTLHIAGMKVKGDKAAKKGRTVTLTATGDVLAQLNTLADKHAHVKVTGDVTGETMAVKEATEAPADAGAKPEKKKKKDNV